MYAYTYIEVVAYMEYRSSIYVEYGVWSMEVAYMEYRSSTNGVWK